ncbi:MAG: hypothetical protein IID44_20505 [Planctomycetes bacterium]|nr:hypothetical protein [Planctomycetota bacterium]
MSDKSEAVMLTLSRRVASVRFSVVEIVWGLIFLVLLVVVPIWYGEVTIGVLWCFLSISLAILLNIRNRSRGKQCLPAGRTVFRQAVIVFSLAPLHNYVIHVFIWETWSGPTAGDHAAGVTGAYLFCIFLPLLALYCYGPFILNCFVAFIHAKCHTRYSMDDWVEATRKTIQPLPYVASVAVVLWVTYQQQFFATLFPRHYWYDWTVGALAIAMTLGLVVVGINDWLTHIRRSSTASQSAAAE